MEAMDLKTFKKELEYAVGNNTLLIPKHDPNNQMTFGKYRTVLSHEASASLAKWINAGDYTVHEYCNTNPHHLPPYLTITPTDTSYYNIAASGIPANSSIPTHTMNRIVVVSGSDGWHAYGEDQSVIDSKVLKGELIDKGKLRE